MSDPPREPPASPSPDDEPSLRAYEFPVPERPTSATPTEHDLEQESPGGILARGHDPYAALRYEDYRRYLAGSLVATIGQQMTAVAVGWELYERTHSATALGLVGLVQALPIILLALPAGHTADLFDRKRIVLAMLATVAALAFNLAATSYYHAGLPATAATRATNAGLAWLARTLGESETTFTDPSVPVFYLLLLLISIAAAFLDPARAALLPRIVPMRSFNNAVTWSSSGFQIASMVGPAAGGLVIGFLDGRRYCFAVVYLLSATCVLIMLAFFAGIRGKYEPGSGAARDVSLDSLVAGLRFVRRSKIILATITLDMFAVLFGGATALLPLFAKDILLSDATALGWLRAAPSLGALLTALILAHLPPMRRAGITLLWSVAGFGVATIVFGLSHWFWLSFVMLLLTGAFDNVSVVVRHTLVQVLTPDALRGRVSAINYVFIGTSNELGAFESGITAAVFGPVLSVVGGGVGTIAVVLAVALIWPQVRRLGRLDAAQAPE